MHVCITVTQIHESQTFCPEMLIVSFIQVAIPQISLFNTVALFKFNQTSPDSYLAVDQSSALKPET